MKQKLFALSAILAFALCTVPPTVCAQMTHNPIQSAITDGAMAQSIGTLTANAALATGYITHCGQTLHANTQYTLSANIGSDLTARCLTLTGPNLVINLGGHTIRGTLKAAGIDHNGIHIHSGNILCNDNQSSMPGCLYIGSGASSFRSPIVLDHLAVNNSGTSSSNSERNIMLDFSSISYSSVTGPNVILHDLTSTSATGLSSSRIVNLQVQGTAHSNAAYASFYNNTTTCKSTAAACQGIVAYGLYNTKIHNNHVINQLSSPSSTETPRGILCDQTDGCEIYSNVIDAQDGRAVRLRGTSARHGANSVHDNTIKNIVAGSNGNHVAAFHIGDPDSGTEYENATITRNTIYFISGQTFMVRSASGVNITGNTVVTNTQAKLLDLRNDGAPSSATISNTTLVGGSGTNYCESGTSGKVCKSGNVSGVCTMSTGC
jgi:hypothetical protein